MRARLLIGGANLALAGLDHAAGRPAGALPAIAAVVGILLVLSVLADRFWLASPSGGRPR